jgi:dTDP-D-glucose 4,6-dehydratase
MKTVLKVTPEVSLEEGLRKTIEWFQKAHFDASKVPASK